MLTDSCQVLAPKRSSMVCQCFAARASIQRLVLDLEARLHEAAAVLIPKTESELVLGDHAACDYSKHSTP